MKKRLLIFLLILSACSPKPEPVPKEVISSCSETIRVQLDARLSQNGLSGSLHVDGKFEKNFYAPLTSISGASTVSVAGKSRKKTITMYVENQNEGAFIYYKEGENWSSYKTGKDYLLPEKQLPETEGSFELQADDLRDYFMTVIGDVYGLPEDAIDWDNYRAGGTLTVSKNGLIQHVEIDLDELAIPFLIAIDPSLKEVEMEPEDFHMEIDFSSYNDLSEFEIPKEAKSYTSLETIMDRDTEFQIHQFVIEPGNQAATVSRIGPDSLSVTRIDGSMIYYICHDNKTRKTWLQENGNPEIRQKTIEGLKVYWFTVNNRIYACILDGKDLLEIQAVNVASNEIELLEEVCQGLQIKAEN